MFDNIRQRCQQFLKRRVGSGVFALPGLEDVRIFLGKRYNSGKKNLNTCMAVESGNSSYRYLARS